MQNYSPLDKLCVQKPELSGLLADVYRVPKSEMADDAIDAIEAYLKMTDSFSELSYHDQLKSYLFLREGYLCRGCTVEAAKNILSQYSPDELLYQGFEKIAQRKLSSECGSCIAKELVK